MTVRAAPELACICWTLKPPTKFSLGALLVIDRRLILGKLGCSNICLICGVSLHRLAVHRKIVKETLCVYCW